MITCTGYDKQRNVKCRILNAKVGEFNKLKGLQVITLQTFYILHSIFNILHFKNGCLNIVIK